MQTRHFLNALALASLALCAAPALADSYPSKPIKIVVPFTAGGPVDVMARLVGDRMARSMQAVVVVENRPGAGGNIGSSFVAKSPADGYTLLLASSSILTVNEALYPKLNYAPSKDFAAISVVGEMPLIVTVNAQVPANTLKELVAFGKAHKDPIFLSSPGNGTTPHLAAELLQREAGIAVSHIPFKGGAESASAMIGGQVTGGIETPPSVLPHVQAGKLRALAVAGPARLASLPNVPTTSEAGYPGLQIVTWFGLVAPAGTPTAVIERLHKETRAALADPEVRARLDKFSIQPVGSTPAVLVKMADADRKTWHKIIADAGIQLN